MVRGSATGEPVAVTAPVLGAAFDELGQAVFGFCLRRCVDREAAEDLLSVVFLEAWRSRERAFATLSSKDRAVADLCLAQGLTPTVAAVALGLPVGTVKSRLAHARHGLRVVLRPGESAALSDPVLTSGHEQGGRSQRVPGTRAVDSWRNP